MVGSRDVAELALLLLFSMPVLEEAAKGNAKLGKKVWSLGPFASGKTEYDGDPMAALGGIQALHKAGPASGRPRETWGTFMAEHAVGGKVDWKPVQVKPADDGYSHVFLPHEHIPFQSLMQNPPLASSSDVLHVQYWAVWTIRVRKAGRFSLDCRGLHTYELVPPGDDGNSTGIAVIGPIAGNIYSASPKIFGTSVELQEEGDYQLFTRVRGKVPLRFSCGLAAAPDGAAAGPGVQAEVHSKNLPDVVSGRLIVGKSPLDIRVRNTALAWLRVRAEVKDSGGKTQVLGSSDEITLAPGAAAQLPVLVDVQGPTNDRDASACVRFAVVVTAAPAAHAPEARSAEGGVVEVPVQLRCRKTTQSALFSFLDPDGSVGVAAVLRPRSWQSKGAAADDVALPIVVSMSGVGVEPQGQADAYKSKPTPDDPGDYIFGFERLWVLAPQRGGPHNWEDVGMRTAVRAIEVLAATASKPRADPNRLLVHGHSRGGHGAWGLATRVPDRVLGVASACGWYSREEYGDANNLWVHETSLMHLDKALLGLLHASVAENENSLHASNLRGVPALVRVGSRDHAVSPWFGRRMARHLREEGVNVTLQEFDQEHWWWDTKQANDGGVMHDPEMRAWTEASAASGRASLEEVLEERDFILTASSPEYLGRFGLRVLQRISPASRASVRIRRRRSGSSGSAAAAATAATGILELRTANTQRLALAPDSELLRDELGAASATATIDVDGSRIAVDRAAGAELCRVEGASNAEATCAAAASGSSGGAVPRSCGATVTGPSLRGSWAPCPAAALRGPALLGPIRRVFAAPWVVVVPDDPTPLETQLAAYFANGHLIAVDTATQVLPLAFALAFRATHRFVWLGAALRFPADLREAWPVQLLSAAAEQEAGHQPDPTAWPPGFAVGPCAFSGGGHGAAFLAPGRRGAGAEVGAAAAATAAVAGGEASSSSPGPPLLDLVVTATGPQALIDLVSFSFATNQPHTRAPMSNMLPDFFVTGPEFRWRGYGGIVAAGYFDEAWRVAPHSAYLHC